MTDESAGTEGGDERVGTVLAGRYRILSRLGEGAMGAVYLGEHLRIGRRDAIKVLRKSMARDEEAIARFTRGARNASGIRHRNVCAIYDFGTTEDGLHFLAMEYVDGGNLTDLLTESGGLPLPRAVSILTQAAGALQVAHDRGIVHRDLKPDNIMLSSESDGGDLVKVVDFDISLGPPEGEGARVTRHGYVVGTPEYMSPEQLTGDPLGPPSDVYSLALVFFRMLTGRLPFDGGTAQEVMVNRLTVDPLRLEEAAPGAEIPEALEPVLRKALERKADERWSSAVEFAEAVRRATGETGSPGRVDRRRAAASPGARRTEPAAVGAGSAGTDESIPRTRVSSTADHDGSDGGGAGDRHPSSEADRRRLWVGGGVALGLVLLVALGLTVFSPFGGDGTADPGGDEVTETAADSEDDLPPADGDDDPVDTDPDPPPVADDDDADDPVTTRDDEPEEPPVTDPEPTSTALPFPSGPPSFELGAVDPSELLVGLVGAGTTPEDRMTDARLAGVRDTAWVVYSGAPINRPDSALAAYLVGSSMIPLGDSIAGVRWLEEAVRLDPLPGFVNLLELHGGGENP